MLKCSMVAVCLLLVAGGAVAEKIGPDGGGGAYIPAGECPTDMYKSYAGPGASLPDNDPAGVVLTGADVTDDGTTFADVIVDIEMSHSWVGDLTVDIGYDETCDGTAETTVRLVCRPAQLDCDPAGSNFGCSDDLSGVYRFSDDGAAALGSSCGSGSQAAGCYGVAGPGALSDFDDMAKGGCFILSVADNAGGDLGDVTSWTVYVANLGTPTETLSWGQIKSRY